MEHDTIQDISKEEMAQVELLNALQFYKETFPANHDICIKIEELFIELSKLK